MGFSTYFLDVWILCFGEEKWCSGARPPGVGRRLDRVLALGINRHLPYEVRDASVSRS